jgi:L-lysine 6-transaminase
LTISPADIHNSLSKYIIVDGFDLVLDLKKSKGCQIHDLKTDKNFLDCFSFFATSPLGINHPKINTPEFIKKIGEIAINKPTNSDVYTQEMAEFVESFGKYVVPNHFKHLFFISGGALAVENGLKTAFDWKVRKNIERGLNEKIGSKVIYFKEAFHGRTGYTLSMTNTFNKNKIKYFSKFKWPRITNPKISFPLNQENLENVKSLEKQALSEIDRAISTNQNDIAALIIEPIQSEGGDNHFRKEFLQELRKICDENEIMYILDEVQTGVGITGKLWAYEHFDFKPDILAFGKKTQICGIMVSNRVDEVKDNVFNVSSRLNSTWGGNLVDMVRCQRYLEIIDEENLIKNAEKQGKHLLNGLQDLADKYPNIISNARGRGLLCAFDLPSPEIRDEMKNRFYKNGLLVVGCGASTIRFRPPLIISENEISKAIEIMDNTVKTV